jgi:hypothetical protein
VGVVPFFSVTMENFMNLPAVLRRSLLAFALFGLAGAQMSMYYPKN